VNSEALSRNILDNITFELVGVEGTLDTVFFFTFNVSFFPEQDPQQSIPQALQW